MDEEILDFSLTKRANPVKLMYCKTHDVKFVSEPNHFDKLKSITITLRKNPLVRCSWNLLEKKLLIGRGSFSDVVLNDNLEEIPYFEPDMSDYNVLFNKIKTYVTFL